MPEIIAVNPHHPEQGLIDRAVKILKEGGVIAYPTETFYGLGVDAENAKAVERIYAIKGRSFTNPIALIVAGQEDVERLVTEVAPEARKLMQAFWPGPLTLVFSAAPSVSLRLTAGTGRIGIRISSHPIATALARTLGRPLTATSANLSGQAECQTADQVLTGLGDRIEAIVDGGETPGKAGSTVLDLAAQPPVILREGMVPAALIHAALKKVHM